MKRATENMAAGGGPDGRRFHAGQLFYGSLSGERNFRILADSGDLSRDERDGTGEPGVISEASGHDRGPAGR